MWKWLANFCCRTGGPRPNRSGPPILHYFVGKSDGNLRPTRRRKRHGESAKAGVLALRLRAINRPGDIYKPQIVLW
jgi:hypothetical protein